MTQRTCAGLLAAAMLASCLVMGSPYAATAGPKSREKTYRIGTYIGGAATIAALAKGKGTWALIGGGATLLSYRQWKKAARRRRQNESAASYRAYRTRWLRQNRGRRIVRR